VVSEGLATVRRENKYGFINRKGKVVVNFQFDDAGDFHMGTHDGAHVAEVAGYLLTGYEHIRAEGSGHNFIVTGRSTEAGAGG